MRSEKVSKKRMILCPTTYIYFMWQMLSFSNKGGRGGPANADITNKYSKVKTKI